MVASTALLASPALLSLLLCPAHSFPARRCTTPDENLNALPHPAKPWLPSLATNFDPSWLTPLLPPPARRHVALPRSRKYKTADERPFNTRGEAIGAKIYMMYTAHREA